MDTNDNNTTVYDSIDGEKINRFLIPFDNMERLKKKLATVRKKCELCNCDFSYVEESPEYKTVKIDGEEITYKYIPVTVDGVARFNSWRFVGTIEHTPAGNIIRTYGEAPEQIPERFRTCSPYCEHCQTVRTRKDTYIIYNDDTRDFKQIGANCLQLYTGGLSASHVAFFVSIFDNMEKYTTFDNSIHYTRFYDVDEIVLTACEVVRCFGYNNLRDDNNTRWVTSDIIDIRKLSDPEREKLRAKLDRAGFNVDNSREKAEKALNYFASLENPENNYLMNLKTLVACRKAERRDFGLLCSLPIAYDKATEKQERENARKAQQASEAQTSDYVGDVGKRITLNSSTVKVLTSYESSFDGYHVDIVYVYKITDDNGNIFIWKTQKEIDSEKRYTITGTVKEHSTYNDVKQTVLTRCKVSEL